MPSLFMAGAQTPFPSASERNNMQPDISHALQIVRYDYPDHRAEAIASTIMENAFSPAYGEGWTPAQLGSFMSLPGVILTLARMDGARPGFALTRHVADEAELMLIAIDPQWQRKAIGKTLLLDCVNHARSCRMSAIYLEVRFNNPAVLFYQKYGFEEVHRRPSYYKGNDGTYYDALSLKLEL